MFYCDLLPPIKLFQRLSECSDRARFAVKNSQACCTQSPMVFSFWIVSDHSSLGSVCRQGSFLSVILSQARSLSFLRKQKIHKMSPRSMASKTETPKTNSALLWGCGCYWTTGACAVFSRVLDDLSPTYPHCRPVSPPAASSAIWCSQLAVHCELVCDFSRAPLLYSTSAGL